MVTYNIKAGDRVIVECNFMGNTRVYNGVALFDQKHDGVDVDIQGTYVFACFRGKVPKNIIPLRHYIIKKVL